MPLVVVQHLLPLSTAGSVNFIVLTPETLFLSKTKEISLSTSQLTSKQRQSETLLALFGTHY